MIINVVIDKSTNANPLLSKKSAYISCNYDPSIVQYLKSLMYKSYEPKSHTWEIQEKDLLKFCEIWGKVHQIKIVDIYKEPKLNTSNIQIPDNYKFKIEPFEFQKEGIKYGLNQDSFLLADEMGLGKSMESIYITDIKCKNKVLVICCSNSIKYNWVNEIQKFTNQKAYILGKNGKGSGKERLKDLENIENIDAKYLITNIQTLPLLKEKKGRSYIYPIAQKINELCNQGIIEAIIIDEFHLQLKQITSYSSKALLKMQDVKNKIAMTGTPVVNTPLDVFVVLKWLGIINNEMDYWRFSHTFGIFNTWGAVIGYKNLNELSALLRNKMLRRTKEECIDLPEKTIIDELIDMSYEQRKLYKSYSQDYIKHIISKVKSEEPLGTLMDMRKITAFPHLISDKFSIKDSVKLNRLKELLEQITQSGHKAVIFSNWTTVTNILKDELKEYCPAYITGEVSNENRQKEVDKFMTDPTCKICIGTIGAMGVGLTLTSANYAIFFDEPWNQATYDQCADRVYRVGQTNKVTVYNLMCANSIDTKIHDLIRGKGQFAKFMVSGSIKGNIDNKELLEALVSEMEDVEDMEPDIDSVAEADL